MWKSLRSRHLPPNKLFMQTPRKAVNSTPPQVPQPGEKLEAGSGALENRRPLLICFYANFLPSQSSLWVAASTSSPAAAVSSCLRNPAAPSPAHCLQEAHPACTYTPGVSLPVPQSSSLHTRLSKVAGIQIRHWRPLFTKDDRVR